MMTGDSERTAAGIASQAGITEYYAEVLPEDKAGYVERAKAEGHRVIMPPAASAMLHNGSTVALGLNSMTRLKG